MKISIVGAGNVGGLAALRIAQDNLGDVYLIDVAPGLARAKAYDLDDCRQMCRIDYRITGTEDLAQVAGSDIVVITAGLARKPGMTREDLLKKNAAIMQSVCAVVKEKASRSIVIVVTNPLDVMTGFALRALGFIPQRVFGMGATLDGARFANLISQETGVACSAIKPLVVGSHGEAMVPLARLTMVGQKPLTETCDASKVRELVQRTIDRGKEIVSLFGSGSAYFAPSCAIAQLVKAIVCDEKLAVPVCAFLSGEYGLRDLCIGVPAIIGKAGVEKIIELSLNQDELSAVRASAESVVKLSGLLNTLSD